jgi:hypothetical protein
MGPSRNIDPDPVGVPPPVALPSPASDHTEKK